MKKFLKISAFILLAAVVALSAFAVYLTVISGGTEFDENKLKKVSGRIVFYDSQGAEIEGATKILTNDYVPSSEIPEHLKNAFISIEDRNFYRHGGIDYKRMAGAALQNLKSGKFKQGASTISQQLIKNTHLSNEKTLERKAKEIRLTRKLESKFTKEQILEMYLNTIYFGENAYGIGKASQTYFGKTPQELDISEAAVLAAVIKAPSAYSPFANSGKCLQRRNLVIDKMREYGYITENECDNAKQKAILLCEQSEENAYECYLKHALKEAESKLTYPFNTSDKDVKIYTYLDKTCQSILENIDAKDVDECGKSYVLIDNSTGGVAAFYSTLGDVKRMPGSAIKPLLVYAPAIEENIVDIDTPILDEETDFYGYRPENYNGKYYGYVSVRDAVKESLNIPAVKILNYTGIEKSKKYAEKLGITFDKQDTSLSLALGGMRDGVELKTLANAYSAFANGGTVRQCGFVKKICDKRDNVLYKKSEENSRVFSEESSFLVNEMLVECAESGTAKKLSHLKFKVGAKTGTVGFKDGNTDAYTISYTKDFSMGVWLGNADNEKMPNSVSGGTYPAVISRAIWEDLHNSGYNPAPFDEMPDGITETALDKISLNEEHMLKLAGDNAREQDITISYFKNARVPKIISERFSNPKIENYEILYENRRVKIILCLSEYYVYELYRSDERTKNVLKTVINDSKEFEYEDGDVTEGKIYSYSIVPYYINISGEKIAGETVKLPNIKIPARNIQDNGDGKNKNGKTDSDLGDWWSDDFE